MKILTLLLDRKHRNPLVQFIKYFFVGGIAAVIDISSFMFFVYLLHFHYVLSIFLSFTLGTLINFILCNLFVFDRGGQSLHHTLVKHYLSAIGGLITNELVMIFFVESLGYTDLFIAKLAATAIAFLVNFTFIKFFAFSKRNTNN